MNHFAALLLAAATIATPLSGYAQTMGTYVSPDAVVDEGPQNEDRSRAIGCLATAIAYEAGYEPIEGQQAVAEVILNRLRHPAFPKTVCGVVFAGSTRRTGCQFSFTCDGSLKRQMAAAVLANTRLIATAAIDGQNPVRVSGATHYHADYVSPYWAPSLIRVTKIGAHIFYRGAGGGDQGSIAKPYSPFGEPSLPGAEPNIASNVLPRQNGVPQPSVASSVFAPWGLLPPTAN